MRPLRLADRRAFVVAAEQSQPDQLWGALALAQQLHRLSRYPVVLLTDIHNFPDGAPVRERLRLMGVDVRFLSKDVGHVHLQVWNLTEFKKVIWIEAESIVYRSIDWLFERDWMWASRHDPKCRLESDSSDVSIMLLFPSEADYSGLVMRASEAPELSSADLIETYFEFEKKQPIHLLGELDASSGECMGSGIPTPYRNSDGAPVTGTWSMPNVVHRSGSIKYGEGDEYTSDNVCFSIRLDEQLVGGEGSGNLINVCHQHPFATYWRDSFCVAAVQILNVKHYMVEQYCNDNCYYQGKCDDEEILEVKQ